MLTIDADAHVLETEQTWEYMDGADKKYRPKLVGSTDGDSKDEYWLVDGTLRLKSGNVGRNTPPASREMRDVPARLKHMDELKVDIQVLYPTLFLIPLTPRPEGARRRADRHRPGRQADRAQPEARTPDRGRSGGGDARSADRVRRGRGVGHPRDQRHHELHSEIAR